MCWTQTVGAGLVKLPVGNLFQHAVGDHMQQRNFEVSSTRKVRRNQAQPASYNHRSFPFSIFDARYSKMSERTRRSIMNMNSLKDDRGALAAIYVSVRSPGGIISQI